MAAIIAPASLAFPPTPFLLRDMSDSLGQMVVVPDDRWEYMITLLRDDYLNPNQELQFIETDQGPFIYLPDMQYLPNGTNENGIYEFPFTKRGL